MNYYLASYRAHENQKWVKVLTVNGTLMIASALLATVHHFHYYLSGVYFKAFTDHKPLINILDGQPPSARFLRWKIKLADYHFD